MRHLLVTADSRAFINKPSILILPAKALKAYPVGEHNENHLDMEIKQPPQRRTPYSRDVEMNALHRCTLWSATRGGSRVLKSATFGLRPRPIGAAATAAITERLLTIAAPIAFEQQHHIQVNLANTPFEATAADAQ
jgi:hypothetical protein